MLKEFKEFLTKSNALALAIGVIIGAATGKIVTAIVGDVLMPVVTLFLPAGDWRTAKFVIKTATDASGKISETSIAYGDLGGTIIDFVIIAAIVFMITKLLVPKTPPAPPSKTCPECAETVLAAAHKCKFCGSAV